MSRYFYRDPLAAAWMVKHFGMSLLADTDLGGLVDAGSRFIDFDDTFRELWQHDFSYLGNLYIHPESLYLLEIQAGDIVIGPARGQSRGGPVMIDEEFKALMPNGVISFPVIFRKGAVFMWPEVEHG